MRTCSLQKSLLLAIPLSITAWVSTHAQSIDALEQAYSGSFEWSAASGTLTFTESGVIQFEKPDHKEHFWEVPATVREIFIAPNTVVTGAFHTFADCKIQGMDRESSIVYGTYQRDWSGAHDVKEWYYCQFQNFGGTLTLKNLTCLNPFSYFVRGWETVNHVRDCNFIDYRGGEQSHSDGFSGGDGSTVENSYFECGDDVFKAYFENTIRNCTIKMILNTVPIQLGWGNYADGAKCTFENLTIIGEGGRTSTGNAIIDGRRGSYSVEVNLANSTIKNPFASLTSLWESGMQLKGVVSDSTVQVYQGASHREGRIGLVFRNSDISFRKPLDSKSLMATAEQIREIVSAHCSIDAEVESFFSVSTHDKGDPQEYQSVEALMQSSVSDSNKLSFAEYASRLWSRERMHRETPVCAANALRVRARLIQAELGTSAEATSTVQSRELYHQLQATAAMAHYYANKLEAAVYLEFFQTFPVHHKENQRIAVEFLTQAAMHARDANQWLQLGENTWQERYRNMLDDVTFAKGAI